MCQRNVLCWTIGTTCVEKVGSSSGHAMPCQWCLFPATTKSCQCLQVCFCVFPVQRQYKRVNSNFCTTTSHVYCSSTNVTDLPAVWPRFTNFLKKFWKWKYFFRLIGCEYNAKCTPECPILQVLPCDLTGSVVTISFTAWLVMSLDSVLYYYFIT